MADLADDANNQAEMLLNVQLKARMKEGPKAKGKCLNCEKKLPRGVRWCDAECRDEHQRFSK